jgi:multidrug efflux system outer membrane protein
MVFVLAQNLLYKGKKMRKRFILYCAAFLFCASLPLEALTLEAALNHALTDNADLQKSALELSQAVRNKKYDWNQFSPEIIEPSISLGHTHPLYPLSASGVNSEGWAWGSVSIGARFVFSADKFQTLKNLDASFRAQVLSYDKTRLDLIVAVSNSFYRLLASQLNIKILSDDVELKKGQHETVLANYGRGLASELEALNAEYAYRTAGPVFTAAVNRYREDLAAFCILIGLDPKEEPALEGIIESRLLELPSASVLAERYLAQRSDVLLQQNALEQALITNKTGVLGMAPSLSLSETLTLAPEQNAGLSYGDPALSGRFSVSLTLPLNSWIPGYPGSVSRKNNADKAAAAEIALKAARKNAEQDIWKKANAVARTAELLESSALNSRIAGRAYELSEQAYRSGLVSQDDLHTANQKELEAELAAVNAKVDYLSALYDLASALNMEIYELYELYGAKEVNG